MLFRIRAEFEVSVSADDEESAVNWLEDHQDWLDTHEADYDAIEVTDINAVPEEWRDAIPFGPEDPGKCWDITCRKIIATDMK